MGLPHTDGPVGRAPRTLVDRDLIGGVPVLWDEQAGPLTVTLMFRVGQVDETLRTHGITRLVEHLVRFAADLEHPPPVAGGNQLFTTFAFTGSDAAAAAYLAGLARAMATLPLDRITWAADILRAEARPASDWPIHLHALRHGPQGFGLAAFDEFGLMGVDPSAVDQWHRKWFNVSNAVLVCSRRPPRDIDLSPLPTGQRQAAPALSPTALDLPASYPGPRSCVAVGFETVDDPAAHLATSILQGQITERLAEGTGNVQPPRVSTQIAALGTGLARVACFVEVADEHAQEVQSAMSAALFRLGMSGPTPHELEIARADSVDQGTGQEPGRPSPAQTAAKRELLGGDTDPAGWYRRSADVTEADVARVVRSMILDAIWLMPPGVRIMDQRIVPIPMGSKTIVDGNPFLPVPAIVGARRGDRLVVGSDGITQLTEGSAPLTVAFDKTAALQVWPDGARTLWGTDGIRLFIHPSSWQGGDQITNWIDSQIERSLVVSMVVSSGYVLPIDPT